MASVATALSALRQGKPVVVIDDCGVAMIAADAATVTPEFLAFTVRHGAGVVCAVMPAARLDVLGLPAQPTTRASAGNPEFGITVDLIDGVTTGISAADRTRTLQALADPRTTASAFCRPGHVMPVRAAAAGVLGRRDGYHAALDLALLGGTSPCVMTDTLTDTDGELLAGPNLEAFLAQHGLASVTVAQVVAARRETSHLVTRRAAAKVPMAAGVFTMHGFEGASGSEHVALTKGFLSDLPPHLVRTHTHCWLGSVAGSQACSCQRDLEESLELVGRAGRGVVVVLDTKGSTSLLTCASGGAVDATVVSQILDELRVSLAARRLTIKAPSRRPEVVVESSLLSLVAS